MVEVVPVPNEPFLSSAAIAVPTRNSRTSASTRNLVGDEMGARNLHLHCLTVEEYPVFNVEALAVLEVHGMEPHLTIASKHQRCLRREQERYK